MPQFSTGGVKANFLTEEEWYQRDCAAWGAANCERLVELKDKYDPTNLFRVNQNTKPNA